MLGREGDLIPWMRSGQIPMGDMGECLSGCGRMLGWDVGGCL